MVVVQLLKVKSEDGKTFQSAHVLRVRANISGQRGLEEWTGLTKLEGVGLPGFLSNS
jgi:hypothetical protein